MPRVALAALLVLSQPVAAQAVTPLVIRNASVVDVESGRVTAGQSIVVEGTRIRAMGPAARIAVPSGASVLDATGRFVIPGLWDMHVHATGPGIDRLFLPVLVANGVTGVREMFGRLAWYDSARAAGRRGTYLVPRLVGAGHILDGAPQVWPGSIGAKDSAEVAQQVDSLARAGAAFIKVYSRLTPAEFRAAAAAAKAHGLPFAGHVPSLVAVDEALQLGMRSIEHLQMFTTACSSEEVAMREELARAVASGSRGWDSAAVISRQQLPRQVATFDEARCRALATRVAKSGTWMVPTTVVLRSVAYLDDSTLKADDRLRFIPRFFSAGWDPRADFRFRAVTAEGWAQRKQAFDVQRRIVRLLHDAGARFLAGTDLSNPYIYPGFSLHEELANLVGLGFTPLEALRTATREPARFLGMADSLGAVRRGMVADLVILDGNPLADIRHVGRVHAVVLAGALVDSTKRAAVLSAAEAIAAPPRR